METPYQTPTKICNRVNITPSTKHTLCVLCQKEYLRPSDRRRLFKENKKTTYLIELEEVLGITVDINNLTIICKYCSGRVRTVIAKTKKIREDFANYERYVKSKYRTSVEKRCEPGISSPSNRSGVSVSSSKKKKMFSSLENSLDVVPLNFEKENNTSTFLVSKLIRI